MMSTEELNDIEEALCASCRAHQCEPVCQQMGRVIDELRELRTLQGLLREREMGTTVEAGVRMPAPTLDTWHSIQSMVLTTVEQYWPSTTQDALDAMTEEQQSRAIDLHDALRQTIAAKICNSVMLALLYSDSL